MKQTAVLTATSLLSILIMTFHLTDDILFGMAPTGLQNLSAVLIFTVWLFGTLALAERRARYVIVFFGSIFGLAVPVIHMKGNGGVTAGDIGKSGEGFFPFGHSSRWVRPRRSLPSSLRVHCGACHGGGNDSAAGANDSQGAT